MNLRHYTLYPVCDCIAGMNESRSLARDDGTMEIVLRASPRLIFTEGLTFRCSLLSAVHVCYVLQGEDKLASGKDTAEANAREQRASKAYRFKKQFSTRYQSRKAATRKAGYVMKFTNRVKGWKRRWFGQFTIPRWRPAASMVLSVLPLLSHPFFH